MRRRAIRPVVSRGPSATFQRHPAAEHDPYALGPFSFSKECRAVSVTAPSAAAEQAGVILSGQAIEKP
jgi:hypothetical protein